MSFISQLRVKKWNKGTIAPHLHGPPISVSQANSAKVSEEMQAWTQGRTREGGKPYLPQDKSLPTAVFLCDLMKDAGSHHITKLAFP